MGRAGVSACLQSKQRSHGVRRRFLQAVALAAGLSRPSRRQQVAGAEEGTRSGGTLGAGRDSLVLCETLYKSALCKAMKVYRRIVRAGKAL